MRKFLLSTLILVVIGGVRVNAQVTPEEYMEPEYMINSGYSEATAESVCVARKRVLGAPCEPLYERYHNKFVRFLRNCYAYLDPAQEGEGFYHHDIHLSPSYQDL